MGTKHDLLTEKELSSYRVNRKVLEELNIFMRNANIKHPEEVNILDWGCGRGRSVAKLREQGFNAFGVEIDLNVMSNGFELFEKRGLSPSNILKPIDESCYFDNGFFHLIFSEQVFEHIENLDSVLKEHSRLTAQGGIGVHCFPGSKNVSEDHLNMPFVHWFPKNIIRKYWIYLMLLFSYGPKNRWPQTIDKSLWSAADIYYWYINNRTYYRDNDKIIGLLRKNVLFLNMRLTILIVIY